MSTALADLPTLRAMERARRARTRPDGTPTHTGGQAARDLTRTVLETIACSDRFGEPVTPGHLAVHADCPPPNWRR